MTEPTDLHSEISSSAPSPRPLDVAHPTPSPSSEAANFMQPHGTLLGHFPLAWAKVTEQKSSNRTPKLERARVGVGWAGMDVGTRG